jgi:hypothetical protein
MFRKRLVAVCILASVALPSLVVPRVARAQDVIDLDSDTPAPKKKGGGKAKAGAAAPAAAAAPKKAGKGVDIDLDEDSGGGSQAPVVAGQMTEAAASAKQLFDKERWNEAAQALHRVVSGETGDDPGNKQLAEYFLAISLYRLKFYQASYAIFSVIADNPNHVKFKETLLWLAKLATQLPEPADIIERVGKYNDEQVGRFDNDQQRDLFWQLNYMLGRRFGNPSPPCRLSSASRKPSTKASKAWRTKTACATSRLCRWHARTTRLPSRRTRSPTRPRSTAPS